MNVCHMHGGKTPGGYGSPNLRHGRYSKYLPAQLAGQYQAAQADVNLLELRDEIALLDVRIGQVVSRLQDADSRGAWERVGAIHAGILKADKTKDMVTLNALVSELGELSEGAGDEVNRWDEIGKLMEQRRKLVESERKRETDLQMNITSERAMLMIAALVDIVRQHVDDRGILAAISADVGKLITLDVSGKVSR